ncbi:MAG: CHAT domain-containing tetratricopeptide repeat protein, partial [Saprospiraceae bacterium]|nr:CHAT domain-containing tetratricopeptide repeat protein [Saprospiraceae bacterium]
LWGAQLFAQAQMPLDTTTAQRLLADAKIMADSGNFAGAVKNARQAVVIWDSLYPQGNMGTVHALLRSARYYSARDQYEEALDMRNKALDVHLKIRPDNDCGLVELYWEIGGTCRELTQYAKAITAFDRSLALEKNCGGPETERSADIIGNLGYLWNLQGEYQKAIALLEQALRLRQKMTPPDSLDIALSYHHLGMVHKAIHKYDEALKYFESALAIRKSKLGEIHNHVASTYSEMGQVYTALHNYAKALECVDKESAIMEALNATDALDYVYVCYDIGRKHYLLKDFSGAALWYDRMLEIWKNKVKNPSTQLASMHTHPGSARLAMGDFEAALGHFQETKRIADMVMGPENSLSTRAEYWLANTYRKWYLTTGLDSLLEKSRVHYRLAEKGIGKAMRDDAGPNAQRKALAEAIPVFEKAINTEHLFLKKHPQDPIALENAWNTSEAAHSYLLFAATRESAARHFAGIPDAELQQDSLLRAQITALEKKREKLIQNEGLALTDAPVLEANALIYAQKNRHAELLASFEKNYKDYYQLKYERQLSSLEKTRKMLAPNQTLLEYFTGDSSIFVFVVQPTDAYLVELPMNFPLVKWVRELREGIAGYHTAKTKNEALYEKTVLQYADIAHKLYEKLLAPLSEWLTPELIIVPSESLAALPFEALLSSAPDDPGNFNTYPFVLRRHAVHYGYSATMLHQMSERKHRQASEGLLAMAPFYDRDTSGLAMRLNRDIYLRDGFSPLPYTGEEIFRAKRRMGDPALLLSGKEAAKNRFVSLAARYRILHLATHGKANHLKGDFSFLAFSPDETVSENALLSVGELYNLPINADLVLLSACETAIGEAQRGEGVVSLARAFAYTGAKSIVASLWSVNDRSTMQIMDGFYAELSAGKSKNQALVLAKRRYLEENPGQSAHPFFWAGFVAVGDMSPLKMK